MSSNLFEPIILKASCVVLTPLAHHHHDELVEAAKDGALWNLWYTTVPTPDTMRADIERRLLLQEKGEALPFAVVDAVRGKVVGMTSFIHIDSVNRRVEIGGTWYAASAQRTAINTQSKLLLLAHAFETKDSIAVEFRAHYLNAQSRRGIERLGAKLDGILRHHMTMPNGTLRDTCVYSILAGEWPTVKANLHWQLAKPRK